MEVLIKTFVSGGYGYGYGDGGGNGNGYGYGDGYGYGYGYGDGNGGGYGDGGGNGNGNGNGYGDGGGNGNGYGDGYGNGDGNGNGYGYGDGNGGGIKEIDGVTIYDIDDTPTGILSVHGNVAKGFTLKNNVIKVPCYIVKENDKFAHGETLHDAYTALQEKLYDDSTEEERLQAFKDKFPEFDTLYSNRDLFTYHHVLTGSCKFGRQQFVDNHDIDLDGKTTVREFIELTRYSYGGEMVKRVKEYYG